MLVTIDRVEFSKALNFYSAYDASGGLSPDQIKYLRDPNVPVRPLETVVVDVSVTLKNRGISPTTIEKVSLELAIFPQKVF